MPLGSTLFIILSTSTMSGCATGPPGPCFHAEKNLRMQHSSQSYKRCSCFVCAPPEHVSLPLATRPVLRNDHETILRLGAQAERQLALDLDALGGLEQRCEACL